MYLYMIITYHIMHIISVLAIGNLKMAVPFRGDILA